MKPRSDVRRELDELTSREKTTGIPGNRRLGGGKSEQLALRVLHVKGIMDGHPQKCDLLVDTGSTASIIPLRTCQQLGLQVTPQKNPVGLFNYTGGWEKALGSVLVRLQIGKEEQEVQFLVSGTARNVILGMDGLKSFDFAIQVREGYLETSSGERVYCHAFSFPPHSTRSFLPYHIRLFPSQ